MTVQSTTSSIEYVGNGAASVYSFNFAFIDSSDIVVTLTVGTATPVVLAEGDDYTISSPGAAGAITLATPLAGGVKLRIERKVPYTQTYDFRTQGRFSPLAYMDALDRLCMQIQQLLGRVVAVEQAQAFGPPGTFGGIRGFSASRGANVITTPTAVVACPTEDFDDSNVYDPATGRFTAPVAGRYLVLVEAVVGGLTPSDAARVNLRKNGAAVVAVGELSPAAMGTGAADSDWTATSSVAAVVTLGAGEFLEPVLAVQTDLASVTVLAGTRFSALRVLDL